MNARVEIFTTPHCLYSQRVKELLRIKGVKFVEHDITDTRFETVERRRQVPEIFINDMLIGGCNELFDLDECGELDALLKRAVSPAESF